jgi:hypothetical protein
MKGLLLLALIPIALTAAAQPMDHSSMPGMVMPGDTQKPTKKLTGKPGSVKPSGQSMPDHASMPGMNMNGSPGHDMAAMGATEIPHGRLRRHPKIAQRIVSTLLRLWVVRAHS